MLTSSSTGPIYFWRFITSFTIVDMHVPDWSASCNAARRTFWKFAEHSQFFTHSSTSLFNKTFNLLWNWKQVFDTSWEIEPQSASLKKKMTRYDIPSEGGANVLPIFFRFWIWRNVGDIIRHRHIRSSCLLVAPFDTQYSKVYSVDILHSTTFRTPRP